MGTNPANVSIFLFVAIVSTLEIIIIVNVIKLLLLLLLGVEDFCLNIDCECIKIFLCTLEGPSVSMFELLTD